MLILQSQDDQYESLNVSYSTLERIEAVARASGDSCNMRIRVVVSSSPILGKQAFKAESVDFDITDAEFHRFIEAIRARGLVRNHLMATHSTLTDSPAERQDRE